MPRTLWAWPDDGALIECPKEWCEKSPADLDDLDSAMAEYLKRPWVRHDTIDVSVINALIFTEFALYADEVKSGRPFGMVSGTKAREEITKVLRRLGCESIGFMDEFENSEVLLAFTHRGRQVQLRVSAKGWAQMYLKENPWTHKRRTQRVEWEQKALCQGHVAVNSILRDWIKGQVTAIEAGILSFEAVFMPHMLTADGRPLVEHVAELLPKPEQQKVIALTK